MVVRFFRFAKSVFPDFLAALLLVLLYLSVFDPKIDINGDNAAYYSLGKALAQGEGYRQISEPGAPHDNHFPPGYPFLLSLLIPISDHLSFLKAVNGLFFLGSLVVLRSILRRLDWSPMLAGGTALLLGVNAHLLRSSVILMSEIPFLFFTLLSVWLLIGPERETPLTPFRLGGLVAAIAATVYLKTIGIALLFGVLFHLVWEKRWKEGTIIGAGVGALLLPWQLRGAALGGSSYFKQLLMVNPYREELGSVGVSDLWNRFWENFFRYLHSEIPGGLLPVLKTTYTGQRWEWVVGILFVGLLVLGWIKLSRGKSLIGGILVGSFAILLLWPAQWTGVRFLLGVLPFLTALAVRGVTTLIPIGSPKVEGWPVVAALLLATTLTPLREQAKAPYSPAWTHYIAVAEWVKKNTPDSAVVIARKPTLFWYWSGRKSLNYRMTLDGDALIAHIDSVGGTHVVLEQLGYASTGRNLYPAMVAHSERFRQILSTNPPYTALFEILPPPSPISSDPALPTDSESPVVPDGQISDAPPPEQR